MSAFHDVSFPFALAAGAKMKLMQASEIVRLASGRDVRNARWSRPLRQWNIAGAITGANRVAELMTFFEARRGNVHAFRFRDAFEYSSGTDDPTPEDQVLGAGDGTQTVFQLVKSEGSSVRKITKPVAGSVRVSVDGIETTDFTVDALTGLVTLAAAPDVGAAVRAGFLFDLPARFEASTLDITLDACRAGRAANVLITEVREA